MLFITHLKLYTAQLYTQVSYTLPLHKLKNIQVVHTTSLRLSLNTTADVENGFLFHPHKPEILRR